jgi:hypothetical protein
MAMAQVIRANHVAADAIIVIPLTQPPADGFLDFAFLAQAKSMFVQLAAKAQTLLTLRSLCRKFGLNDG